MEFLAPTALSVGPPHTLPLTQGQLGIWFTQMLDPDDPSWNIGECIEICGSLDEHLFEQALRHVIALTEAMLLRFTETNDGPVQYLEHDPNWELNCEDFSGDVRAEEAAHAWMMRDLNQPFRLNGPRFYRFALLRISADRYLWYAVGHHIIMDGVGWRLFQRRVADTYSALAEGNPRPTLPDGSWRDIVASEIDYRSSPRFQKDRSYWLQQLADAPAPVTLSGRSPKRPVGYNKATGRIPSSVDLEVIARRHSARPAALIVSATAIYLHRMTGATDMLIGMPLAARSGAKSRETVGFTANALPLRCSVSASNTIGEVIARATRGMRSTLRHQNYRIEDLRRDLGLSPSDPDINGTYVNFTPFEQDITFAGHKASSNPLGNWLVDDLQFVYYGGTDEAGQRLDIIGNPDHYTIPDLEQHARRFIGVVEQLATAEADALVAEIDLLTATEREMVRNVRYTTGQVVLNNHLEPVPVGVTGELYVDAVTAEAFGSKLDDLVEQRISASPFGDSDGQMCRTGKLARMREDGAIERLGSTDDLIQPGRQALLRPKEELDGETQPVTPPQSRSEMALAEIWSEVLLHPVRERTADFFALGGDSLRTIQVTSRVKKVFEIDLPLSAVFEARTLDRLAQRIDVAVAEHATSPPLPALRSIPKDVDAPLTFSQQRMWVIQSLAPHNTAYNMSTTLRLTGAIDYQALERAIDELLMRHDILRTTYRSGDGEVLQNLNPSAAGALEIVDLTVDYDDPENAALTIANNLAGSRIDLENGPIFIARLMRVAADTHVFHFLVHHIAADHWSLGVIGRELVSYYNAFKTRQTPEPGDTALSYRDYAIWERRYLGGDKIDGQLEYWRHRLAGAAPVDLPVDKPRPRVPTLKGRVVVAKPPESLFDGLEKLARREAATLFMTMFAGYAALLSRLADQDDITIGVPVANRRNDAVEQMMGTFVNLLALRIDLSGDPTFRELIARVRDAALEGFAHQDVPFDRLVNELVSARDTGRAPLAQVMFNVLNAPLQGLEFDGVEWEPVELDRGGSQFELSISVEPVVSKTVNVEYSTDLFNEDTIERFVERYLKVLKRAQEVPETRLSEFDILVDDERQLLLGHEIATEVEEPPLPFISVFEERVSLQPEATAVTFGNIRLSYAELDGRANALAHELVEAGVSRGDLVGVCLDRSLSMVVALLAVQKAGGAYVPLDPELPAERVAFMISDSGLGVIVLSGRSGANLTVPEGIVRVDADVFDGAAAPSAQRPVVQAIEPSDPVYLIYTSGSTGRPKGVLVPHGALANFLTSMQRQPGLASDDILAAVTTISFDIAGLELYLPLQVGAQVEIVPPEVARDGMALAQFIDKRKVNVMQATPATWRMLLDAGWQGRPRFRALCGGEALPQELAGPISERVGELWNLYGPTETTIWSTVCRIDRNADSISIGHPIDNTQVYVLHGLSPCPVGTVGEICIGGDGVAIGYHGRPELTAERFVDNPFAKGTSARMYRTGDLGRWGDDGRLYHLGRMDHQVKIRGFRVETAEIESVLAEHPLVDQAIVVAHTVGPEDVRLVAYLLYQGADQRMIGDIRRYLRKRLPSYMVPAVVAQLDQVPLTPSGKIDRNQLPNPFENAVRTTTAFKEPKSGHEPVIAGIWRELLKVEKISADDNFFELGGHSLLALRFIVDLERKTGIRIDVRNVFFKTLHEIAAGVPA